MAFHLQRLIECGCIASMTRGFTWCGEWRQVAENADSPLEFSMFINHGTHIFDGASGRMSGSAPNASKSVARGSRQGGIGRYFGHPQPRCCDAGWVSDSPPLMPRSTCRWFTRLAIMHASPELCIAVSWMKGRPISSSVGVASAVRQPVAVALLGYLPRPVRIQAVGFLFGQARSPPLPTTT